MRARWTAEVWRVVESRLESWGRREGKREKGGCERRRVMDPRSWGTEEGVLRRVGRRSRRSRSGSGSSVVG
jgi:hypothetical protein